MEMKIMYGALIFVAGWFYFYICLRQLIFDFYRRLSADIQVRQGRRGGIRPEGGETDEHHLGSDLAGYLRGNRLCGGVFRGAVPCHLLFRRGGRRSHRLRQKLGPRTKTNFEAFCRTYCRFVPDDDLRQAMAQADLPKMRAALRALGSDLKLDVEK